MSSNRVNSVNSNPSRPICRYFVSGYCNRGTSCHFLHIQEDSSNNSGGSAQSNQSNGESSSSTSHKPNYNSNRHKNKSAPEDLPICRFFLENRCMFGDNCWNRHEKPENDTNVESSTSTICSQKNDLKNPKDKQKAKEVVEEEYTCAICYETPKMFGLLVQCDHIFCRNCIQEWRKTSNVSSPFQDVDTTKTCPVCRKNSPYIVPSPRFAKSGDQKDQIISTYKEKISRIPCKYFEETRTCPFADACFYQHANPDGTRCNLGPPVKRKKRSYLSSNFRYMSDSDIDFSISEIIGGLHFNFSSWDVEMEYDENAGGWGGIDDDEDEEENEVLNNFHGGWDTPTDWTDNTRGWDGWDIETNNADGMEW
ncbi:13044_t:CDS:1 [Funneliformis geosporum]|uniref:17338_t:CDS:1 n=1 Tax=Funneliformis geosporum TaxID=1117311 RepID=A0A9W4SHE3_9GLOM|nr:17338_t:CDS:1 [Funneliformis geosporum]CAI2170041.1 13044_t:CDS:1 [Funneliformis geosporum]